MELNINKIIKINTKLPSNFSHCSLILKKIIFIYFILKKLANTKLFKRL